MLQIVPVIINSRTGDTISDCQIVFSNMEQKHTLDFRLSIYSRSKLRNPNGLFEPINSLWAKFDIDTQKAVFDIYERAYDAMETCLVMEKVRQTLTQCAKDLLDIHTEEMIERHGYLVKWSIPPTVKTSLGAEDYGKELTTYTREDYRQLIFLSIVLKMFPPIWSGYMTDARRHQGNGFKELSAMSLINDTWVRNCAAMQRLIQYLSAQHRNVRSNVATLNYLGSEDMPEYLLSLAVVKSLAMSEIYVEGNNLVSNIYRTTVDSADKMSKEFNSDYVLSKKPQADTEDEQRSSIEQYRIKAPITSASIVEAEYYLEQMHQVATEIEPEISPWLVDVCYENLKRHPIDLNTSQHYQMITGLVIDTAISNRTVSVVSGEHLMRAMAIAQACLFFWGFSYIGMLLSARCELLDQNVLRNETISGGTLKILQKETIEALHALYPYYRAPKATGGKEHVRGRNDNFGIRWIESMVMDIIRYSWKMNTPPELVNNDGNHQYNVDMLVPGDIREQLAAMLIKINS